MSSIDTNLRILWLSDIHYKFEYGQKNDLFKKYLESFLLTCAKLNEKLPFDYILLSGDIAYAGTEQDYELFKKDILNPLQKIVPCARLLVIPGNHDVNRKAGAFLNDFIKSLEKRQVFFENRFKEFEKIFENFSDAFKENEAVSTECSANYKDNLLQGYLIDHKKKTVFVLLNTAWYSFDRMFLEEYLLRNNIVKNKDKVNGTKEAGIELVKKLIEFFSHLFGYQIKNKSRELKDVVKDIQKIANEYGTQIVGLDHYSEFKELLERLVYYSDYLVITTMHHPANWLSWEERINYFGPEKENKFELLKNKTDLLLTGHEHVPKSHASEFLNDRKLLHIQAGCFITEQDAESFEVFGNWFSVLNINVNKRAVINEKYAFNSDKGDWIKDTDYLAPKKIKKKYNNILSNQRRIFIKESASQLLKEDAIINKLISKNMTKKEDFFVDDNALYQFIEDFDNLDVQMLITALNNQANIDFVYLVFVDLYYEENKEYSSGKDRLLVLQEIKLKIDFQVNKFRHDFFFSLSKNDAGVFRELKIASIIVPYWEYETMAG